MEALHRHQLGQVEHGAQVRSHLTRRPIEGGSRGRSAGVDLTSAAAWSTGCPGLVGMRGRSRVPARAGGAAPRRCRSGGTAVMVTTRRAVLLDRPHQRIGISHPIRRPRVASHPLAHGAAPSVTPRLRTLPRWVPPWGWVPGRSDGGRGGVEAQANQARSGARSSRGTAGMVDRSIGAFAMVQMRRIGAETTVNLDRELEGRVARERADQADGDAGIRRSSAGDRYLALGARYRCGRLGSGSSAGW